MRQDAFSLGWWFVSWWSAGGTLWLACLGIELLIARGGLRHVRRLGATSDDPARAQAWPTVAVLVAARNEEDTVGTAVASILSCDYPQLRVIAVDDRSGDHTGAILDRLALADPRLQVVHVRDLPAGWLGKNHALHLAATRAEADWLLFTDADVRFAPGALRRAVALCELESLEHLTAVPALLASGVWLRLFLAWYTLVLTLWLRPWHAPRPDRRVSVGVGAFNLVRRTAYAAVGGHAAIPLAVADDVVLGRVLKAAGFRQMMVMAGGRTLDRSAAPQLQLQWYPDVLAAVRGLEKNAFAMFGFRAVPLVLTTIGVTAVTLGPWIGAAVAPGWHRLPWMAAALLSSASLWVAGREMMDNFPWWLSVLYPLGQILLTWAALRSAWITLVRGGIRWRDTFYPLRELRAAESQRGRARLRGARG